MILDLDEVTTSTGRYSPNLVVHSGVLQPGLSYTFILNVSLPGTGQWGTASLSVLPNSPPHGGLCDLSPESDIFLLETVVTYNCSGNTVAFTKVSPNPVCIKNFASLKRGKETILLILLPDSQKSKRFSNSLAL